MGNAQMLPNRTTDKYGGDQTTKSNSVYRVSESSVDTPGRDMLSGDEHNYL